MAPGLSDTELLHILTREFDLTPAGIADRLHLKQPIYQETAAYGHFGRNGFPWEELNLS